MDHWQHYNMRFVPQQWPPTPRPPSTIEQPRRPLAINDMLNHGPAPLIRHPPSAGFHSQLPPPVPMEPRAELEEPHHLYLPEPSRPEVLANRGLRLSPAPWPGPNEGRDYHMSHPQEMLFEPPNEPQLSLQLSTTAAKSDVNWKRKICAICLENFEETDPKSRFPHQCKKCASGDFCSNCLKGWFLDACKNESKMPPKCCTIIPISAIINLLSSSQIEIYKAKYEEWATVDRLYCPVPICSTFLPERLYIKILQGPSISQNTTSITTTFNQTEHTKPKRHVKQDITCPTCGVSVCTKCHSYSHTGNCPKSDIDPILEEQLKKWKIKRCPKCRTGVRKMFGCSHVECRCGAHFCFGCLFPINQCQGQCDDEVDPDDSDVAEDDLDGRGFDEGGDLDFGPEPYGNIIDTWGCQHLWSRVIPTSLPILRRQPLECNRCFRDVEAAGQEKPQPNIDADTEMMGITRLEPTTSHHGEPSCHAKEQKNFSEKEDAVAWECRCGMILCGACRVAYLVT